MRYVLILVALFVFAGVAAFGLRKDPPPAPPAGDAGKTAALVKNSALDILKADGHFKVLLAALKDAELEKTLGGDGVFTFFAPLDEAFARVPKLAELLGDREKLRQVLNRHLVPERAIDTVALGNMRSLQPLEGETLKVDPGKHALEINDAKILVPDRRTGKAIVHGIDHVLMKENDSMLREAGGAIENGLKKGAEKIKDAFQTKTANDKNPPAGERKQE